MCSEVEKDIVAIARGLYKTNNPTGKHKTAWKIYLGMAQAAYDVMGMKDLKESIGRRDKLIGSLSEEIKRLEGK